MAFDSNHVAASSSSQHATQSPFEWLAGGLFFGRKGSGGGIESIDTSKDVMSLLTGINDNLTEIVAERGTNGSSATQEPAEVKPEVESSDPTPSKFLAARLSRLRFLLYDERRVSSQQESRRSTPTVAGTALQGLTGDTLHDLMPRLLDNLFVLPFESRKHVAAIFNYLLVSGLDGSDADLYKPIMIGFRDYVESNYERLMTVIVHGHDTSKYSNAATDIGLHCGAMYRSCLRHSSLYRQLVSTPERVEQFVFPFLDVYVHVPNFDVSSDAMESLRLVFTAGGDQVPDEESQQIMAELAAEMLTRDYEEIWDKRFNARLLSDSANYMTRRVALQILSTVLLTRSNYQVMIRYVASRANLILVMHLLRDTSPHITMDAFHVFKVFGANPNKPADVIKILQDNQVKLCRYLTTLHQEKEASDTQFRDEKALIIATIEGL
jgi:hypothetical protein